MRRIPFNIIILIFLFLLEFFPTSFVLADSYELKVSPTTIYAGQEVSVHATAKGTIPCDFNPSFNWTPPLVSAYVNFGDGTSEDLTCYVYLKETRAIGYDICEYSCLLDTTHTYQIAQANPYEVKLIFTWITPQNVAREEVKVIPRPTLTPTTSANPLRSTSIAAIVHQIGNTIFIVGAAGTFLMLLIGGYYLMFSRGNPSLVTKGKRIILISFIGFVILVVARGIIYFVEKILGVS